MDTYFIHADLERLSLIGNNFKFVDFSYLESVIIIIILYKNK